MKTNTNKESGVINELFENQLKDILWAEQELTRFMPKILKQVTSKELKKTFEEHMKITEAQVRRLENIFEIIGSKPEAEKCDGMEGLVKEAEQIIESAEPGVIRDAFIIGAVQKVEHYEMASYGTLRALATIIGEYEVASLLGETLEEEKEADFKLTQVAENFVNIQASDEAGELEDEEFEELDEEEEEFGSEEDEEDEKFQGSTKGRSKSGLRK